MLSGAIEVHPIQHREQVEVSCVAEVHDIRSVRVRADRQLIEL